MDTAKSMTAAHVGEDTEKQEPSHSKNGATALENNWTRVEELPMTLNPTFNPHL